ncbi:MAG: dihydropteroate synthase [Selenomonadaceae bacterium]|nr:dihydropteroate synthase [Selenomonadaceae bacterium]
MRRCYVFRDGKKLTVGEVPLVMGILNITPDSFSDGGKYDTPSAALQRLQAMAEEGAAIIDVGAESTRPGATPLTAEEEMARLKPILPLLVKNSPIPLSLDTYHAATAAMGIAMGVHIINDIWGLQYAPEPNAMARTVAKSGLPVIIMHNDRATADTECGRPHIMTRANAFLSRSLEIAAEAGIATENIILDPGICFGTTPEEDVTLLTNLSWLKIQRTEIFPLLVGLSRKSFLGKLLNLPPDNRLGATAAMAALAVAGGADILRLHDVKEIAPAMRLVYRIVTAPPIVGK